MAQQEYGLLHIETRNPLTRKEFTSYFQNHLRSLYGACDVDVFFALVSRALDDYYATFRVRQEERFIFTPLYPKHAKTEVLGKAFNYLTYRLVSRVPGMLAKGSGSPKHHPPFVFDGPQDPNYSGYKTEDTVNFRSNIVQFDVQSTSYALSEEFSRWFESQFMPTYEGSFQAYGINHIHFKERLADAVDVVYENTVYVRSLRYEITTQMVSTKSIKTLDSLSHVYEL